MPDERTTLKASIDSYLKTLAPSVWYRKRWGGGVYQHSGEWDYVLCVDGQHVEVEAKHPVTKPPLKADQENHGRRIRAAGGITVSVTSRHELENAILAIRLGHVGRGDRYDGG